MKAYEEVGVDQVIFVLQAGNNTHEHIMESLELFGTEVRPEFAERDAEQRAAKASRLASAVEAAMAEQRARYKFPSLTTRAMAISEGFRSRGTCKVRMFPC